MIMCLSFQRPGCLLVLCWFLAHSMGCTPADIYFTEKSHTNARLAGPIGVSKVYPTVIGVLEKHMV